MSKTLSNKTLDDLNRHILEELQKDARLPTVEIGRRVGLSPPAVADRIQKLEDQGIIKGYQTVLDFDKMGLSIRAFILFKPAHVKHPDLINLVESLAEVVDWHTITGNYAILLKVAVCSSEKLAALIERLEEFGETNTSLILTQNPSPKIIGGT